MNLQNRLFGVKVKLNGMYYNPKSMLYESYSQGKKNGEWSEEHFKQQGFTKEAMLKVRERVLQK